MGAATASTEIHGGDGSESEKWDLCSGGDGGATADDGRGREGEPQRGSGSFEFAGDVFLHPHHHNLAVGGVEFCFYLFFVLIFVKRLEKSFVSKINIHKGM